MPDVLELAAGAADPSAGTLGPLLGALATAAVLAVGAFGAAALDGALAARGQGGHIGHGLLRPVRETARLLRQRRRVTPSADLLLWRTGASLLVLLALLKATLIPLGDGALFDPPEGVVWFNAFDVTVWAAVWLTGWGANAVHPLVGGYRFLALALAYELPLMFALTAPAILSGSLDVEVIAAAQTDLWWILGAPVAFLVYCTAMLALSLMGPFASPIGPDIAGGVQAELSGADRLLVTAGRYALLTTGAAFAVPLFLGGGAGPLLPPWAWTLVKTLVLLAALLAVRRALPRARPDRFLELGWMVLIPAILLQDLITAIVAVATSEGMTGG